MKLYTCTAHLTGFVIVSRNATFGLPVMQGQLYSARIRWMCVCVGGKCVGGGVCGMRVKEVCMRGERSKVGQEEALSTNEPVVRLISMVPQRIFPSAVPPYPK